MGVKLRRLRAERGLSQTALAQALGLSPSYLDQLEQNQRPLTVAVLLRLQRALDVDVQAFSKDEEARLVAGLREALADALEPVALPELQEVAAQMPALGRAVVALHRRAADLRERLEMLSLRLGDDRADTSALPTMPFEVVRDFFFAHQNHFDPLERAAEAPAAGMAQVDWLERRLAHEHGVRVVLAGEGEARKRRYDVASRTLRIHPSLGPAQRAFRLAT